MLFITHNRYAYLSASDENHTRADEPVIEHGSEATAESGEFNPGDFMFDHIKDAHEWHILTLGKTHVSIPLPVILYSKISGLNIFMSGKFKHGHESFRGFHLETEGDNKGKIFEEDGTRPLDLSITKNIAAMFFSIALLLWVFLAIGKKYRQNPLRAPSGLQSAIEPIVPFCVMM